MSNVLNRYDVSIVCVFNQSLILGCSDTVLYTNDNTLPLRESLVKTAVQFLQNPKVSSSPLVQKQEFFKRKGLMDEEIKTAFKLASVDNVADRNAIQSQNPYTAVQMPSESVYPYRQMSVYRPTFLHKVKEIFNATALIGVTVYCAYWFYKSNLRGILRWLDIPRSHPHLHYTVN
ncbi:PREDICTED: uncharacterized protein LOC105564764 [Vollenhovia emeryi]|uniref:uncharacterized protein LOC105564764 n=1 Tax=Vollenhovia emeryi TaxID=411798 RepID=UPI0005F572C3|nr:PREDICTED: uncharacterized protein LOC105564764 [Vollenhovia emeryi]